MTEAHVLVVDDDKINTKTIGILLRRLNYQVTEFNSPTEALRWLQLPGNFPDLVISDLMMPEMDGYQFVSNIRAMPITAQLPVIMLTASGQLDHKVEGFKVGVDDYLVKPIDRVELEWRIKALLARTQKAREVTAKQEAKIISVFSLRGGVGTSTMAINLALALTQMTQHEIPLIDLSLKNGHCALMLNLNPVHTVADIVDWDTSTIEAETIERLLLKHRSGVKLLAAPKSPAEAELVTVEVIDHLWPYLRATYPYIIIDAGSQLVEPAVTLLERSQMIVLMLSPDLASIMAAVTALEVLDQLDITSDRIMPVVNRIFAGNSFSTKDMQEAIKHKIFAEIPYNQMAFVQAINSGQPHLITNPNSAASQAIIALAHKLTHTDASVTASANNGQWLNWAKKLVAAA
jgi:pilus assembly protein CpaE